MTGLWSDSGAIGFALMPSLRWRGIEAAAKPEP